MTIEILETQGVTKPQGLYNHAISVSAGRLLFIAGQVAIDEHNHLRGMVGGDRGDRSITLNSSAINPSL